MTRREALRLAFFLGGGAAPAVGGSPVRAAEPHSDRFERPFSADSPWNILPVAPVLGSYRLPASLYHPFVGQGAYSTGVFATGSADPPMRVDGAPGSGGVWCVDDALARPLELPHWPPGVQPATGGDGHADIVDVSTGLIHSFWQLRGGDGRWTATQYAWSRLDGRGWPDPAHNHQGARAAGVPTLGGLMRTSEVADSLPLYGHVLAMSLPGQALARGYVYPAAAEDDNAPARYTGQVPMGSLMMLPAGFDAGGLQTPALRKIAATLMRFGARVVDQNLDTRFALYVQNGADFNLHAGGWSLTAANDLDRIADALRPVASVSGWLTADGQPVTPPTRLNLLSMRGPWRREIGTGRASYDSWRQSLVLQAVDAGSVFLQQSGQGARRTSWAPWQPGRQYRFRVRATGGARLQLRLHGVDGRLLWQSVELGDGESADLQLPGQPVNPALRARGGSGGDCELGASFIEQTG